MSFPFANRWALVTGAGDGIGLALALGFARAGSHVVVADIRADAAAACAAQIAAMGGQSRALALDVSDRDAMLAAAESLAGEGIVPALVWANAGVAAGANVLDASSRTIEWVLAVNVLGVVWTAQAFARRLRDLEGPRAFGMTASSACLRAPEAPFPLYAASKHAAAALAEAIEADLSPHGVHTHILYPGLLNTSIWDAARARPDRFGGVRHQAEATGARWRAAPGPQEVVEPVLAALAAGDSRVVVLPGAETRAAFGLRHGLLSAALARAAG